MNPPEEIYESFKPYYELTSVGEQADPQQLYELSAKLDEWQVYHKAEVEHFCEVYFKAKAIQTSTDHAKLNAILDVAVERFKALAEDEQNEYRGLLGTFRNLYSFLSQIIPYQDTDLEKLYTYARFLLTKLPKR